MEEDDSDQSRAYKKFFNAMDRNGMGLLAIMKKLPMVTLTSIKGDLQILRYRG
jgi:hypothetical protein